MASLLPGSTRPVEGYTERIVLAELPGGVVIDRLRLMRPDGAVEPPLFRACRHDEVLHTWPTRDGALSFAVAWHAAATG